MLSVEYGTAVASLMGHCQSKEIAETVFVVVGVVAIVAVAAAVVVGEPCLAVVAGRFACVEAGRCCSTGFADFVEHTEAAVGNNFAALGVDVVVAAVAAVAAVVAVILVVAVEVVAGYTAVEFVFAG